MPSAASRIASMPGSLPCATASGYISGLFSSTSV